MNALHAEPISGDAPDLLLALKAEDLPTDDLAEPDRVFFRFAWQGATVGYGGLELHGGDALLRSLVVLPAARGKGLGREATAALLSEANRAGAATVYLLTTSAAPFFGRAGFKPVERATAPAAILATRQAASLCPSTAALLARPTLEETP